MDVLIIIREFDVIQIRLKLSVDFVSLECVLRRAAVRTLFVTNFTSELPPIHHESSRYPNFIAINVQ